jgi:hypothetical protein
MPRSIAIPHSLAMAIAPHTAGTDSPHCAVGATAVHAPATLLWRAGPEGGFAFIKMKQNCSAKNRP